MEWARILRQFSMVADLKLLLREQVADPLGILEGV